jgi:hypothetical protein
MRLSGDGGYYYEIRGGSVNLLPSQLLADQSYTKPLYPPNPKVAQGYFASGATLTMTGSIWHIATGDNPTEQEIFSGGTILTGTVGLNFYVKEQDYQPNVLNSQLDIHITGGELLNGATTGMRLLDNHAIADILLFSCSQYGSPGMKVQNFASDISYLAPSMIQMYAAPEPFTVLFLGFGSLFALRIRKR